VALGQTADMPQCLGERRDVRGWVPYVGNVDQSRDDLAEQERLHALYGVTGMTRQIDWTGATLAITYWRRTGPRTSEDITALVLAGERGED
jgi:hypothetical protein